MDWTVRPEGIVSNCKQIALGLVEFILNMKRPQMARWLHAFFDCVWAFH